MGRKESLIKELKSFVNKVRKIVDVEEIILFGSRVRGDFREDSDIDLIIISEDFEGIKSFKRSPQFYLLWDLPYDVDIICLTPEEFDKKKSEIGVIRDAVSYGVEL